jgi:hypothetical protein
MNLVTLRLSSLHLLVFCSLAVGACKVDESGLGVQTKLQRDGSAPAPDVGGAAGAIGTAGSPDPLGGAGVGVAGALGTGGTAGESSSVGGAGSGGTAGTPSSGGMTGAAGSNSGGSTGVAGATGGTGGVIATGGAGGGATGGTGGVIATGGTGGVISTGGTGGVISTGGTGGVVSTGGTGGIVATGGASGGGATGTGGSPPPPCGPGTCANGCCSGNTCVHTRSATFCGNGGQACKACMPCEMCTGAFVCDIDPNSDWTIVAVSASVDSSPSRGGNWDPAGGMVGGKDPDLFCQFEQPPKVVNNTTTGVTDTIKDVFSASWNTVITPSGKFVKASDLMTTQKPWRLWVGDDDGCGLNGCVGETMCEIDPPLSASVLHTGTLTKDNYMFCKSLVLKFLCQD